MTFSLLSLTLCVALVTKFSFTLNCFFPSANQHTIYFVCSLCCVLLRTSYENINTLSAFDSHLHVHVIGYFSYVKRRQRLRLSTCNELVSVCVYIPFIRSVPSITLCQIAINCSKNQFVQTIFTRFFFDIQILKLQWHTTFLICSNEMAHFLRNAMVTTMQNLFFFLTTWIVLNFEQFDTKNFPDTKKFREKKLLTFLCKIIFFLLKTLLFDHFIWILLLSNMRSDVVFFTFQITLLWNKTDKFAKRLPV